MNLKQFNFLTIDDINKIAVKDDEELRHIIQKRYSACDACIDVDDLDVSCVKSFNNAFSCCHNLKKINGLETWDTSNAESMDEMFNGLFIINNVRRFTF